MSNETTYPVTYHKKHGRVTAIFDQNKPHHYFVTSSLNWSTDADLLKALTKQKKEDTRKTAAYHAKCADVWLVPLPADAEYKIENFRPCVDGIVYLGTITY